MVESEAVDAQGAEHRDAAASLAVGVDQAKAAGDGDVLFDEGEALADGVNLGAEAVDELGLVATGEEELSEPKSGMSATTLRSPPLGTGDAPPPASTVRPRAALGLQWGDASQRWPPKLDW